MGSNPRDRLSEARNMKCHNCAKVPVPYTHVVELANGDFEIETRTGDYSKGFFYCFDCLIHLDLEEE